MFKFERFWAWQLLFFKLYFHFDRNHLTEDEDRKHARDVRQDGHQDLHSSGTILGSFEKHGFVGVEKPVYWEENLSSKYGQHDRPEEVVYVESIILVIRQVPCNIDLVMVYCKGYFGVFYEIIKIELEKN